MSEKVKFEPGDKVSILEHRRAPALYPNCVYTEPASEGWVVAGHAPLSRPWQNKWMLERIDPNNGEATRNFIDGGYMALVEKGPGSFIPGVSRPYSEREIKAQRFDAFLERLDAATQPDKLKHQGYSNAATFLAVTYLRNDHRFAEQMVPQLRRKDGSLNPERVRKAFSTLGLRVDGWATESPIDVPGEFAHYNHGAPMWRLNVNWPEVAEDFRAEESES